MIVRLIVEALSDVAVVKQVVHDPEGVVAQLLGYRPQGQDVPRIYYAPVIGNGHTKFHRLLPRMATKRVPASVALIGRGTWYHFSAAEANTVAAHVILSDPDNPLTERRAGYGCHHDHCTRTTLPRGTYRHAGRLSRPRGDRAPNVEPCASQRRSICGRDSWWWP